MTTNSESGFPRLFRKGRRFLSKSRGDQAAILRYWVRFAAGELRSRLVYPLPSRIDDVGWFFTGFDTVGEYIRSGCFEEAERLFVRRV
ncbi:MAG: hypothetical protein NTY23_09135, partial [Chloroflexi bacterium]|nr:hypothetical protein [Chloroflexota bacterium]